jgi:protein-arginine kinase
MNKKDKDIYLMLSPEDHINLYNMKVETIKLLEESKDLEKELEERFGFEFYNSAEDYNIKLIKH